MLGGIDDIPSIVKILSKKKRTLIGKYLDYTIHVDAAIYGPLIPTLEPYASWKIFSMIDTFSFSAYKLFGHPIPCGVVLTSKEFFDKMKNSQEISGVYISL